jgi:hypothetical protein
LISWVLGLSLVDVVIGTLERSVRWIQRAMKLSQPEMHPAMIYSEK